jgi:hydroxymethylbilane synthase
LPAPKLGLRPEEFAIAKRHGLHRNPLAPGWLGLALETGTVQAVRRRIGTRGSPLALAQAREVCRRLAQAHGLPEAEFEIVAMTTSGDRIQNRPLSEAGGKGLFTKEIEEALLAGAIDLAVHSAKDMPTILPDGLAIVAFPPREDVRDAFISTRYTSLDTLPAGAVVGTSSLRRQAQALRRHPHLRVVGLRGNVETRLRKLEAGDADATLLACAGLNRLGLQHRITAPIEPDVMLPAVAQGAIAIEIRARDDDAAQLLAPINHEATALCVAAERAFLAKLDGSCRTPIAGLATLSNGRLHLTGEILTPDGAQHHAGHRDGLAQEALRMGEDLAAELLGRAGPDFFRALA